MLTHPTVEKLHELRCPAMARALSEQLASPQVHSLSFEERLGLLVDLPKRPWVKRSSTILLG